MRRQYPASKRNDDVLSRACLPCDLSPCTLPVSPRPLLAGGCIMQHSSHTSLCGERRGSSPGPAQGAGLVCPAGWRAGPRPPIAGPPMASMVRPGARPPHDCPCRSPPLLHELFFFSTSESTLLSSSSTRRRMTYRLR